MRLVRYGALVLGVMLLVSVGFGSLVQRSQLDNTRASAETRLADRSAAYLSSLIEVAEVTARLADDRQSASAVLPEMAAVTWSVETLASAPVGAFPTTLELNGRSLVVTAAGPRLLVSAAVDTDELLARTLDAPDLRGIAASNHDVDLDVRGDVMASPGERAPAPDGPPAATASVRDGSGVIVAVSLSGGDGFDTGVRKLMLVLVVLAVLLLVLAGVTVVAEARSLVRRARFDQLTGLPNRSEFERRGPELLAASRRSQTSVCLLMFDLDGFKEINDAHGHRVGDEVLAVLATRLRRAVRDSDMVARWGGDEFVVVMPGLGDVNLAQARAGALAAEITDASFGDGLWVGVSVGVAIAPLHASELVELVEAADQAMYHAKRSGEVYRLAEQPGGAAIDRSTLSV